MTYSKRIRVNTLKLLGIISVIAIVSSCGKKEKKQEQQEDSRFTQIYNNLKNNHLENSQVVTRGLEGQPDGLGDSLLFTSIYLGSADCADMPPVLDLLENMQDEYAGFFVRYLPLPQEYVDKDNEVSFDGLTGILYGFSYALTRCPEHGNRLGSIWTRFRLSMAKASGRIFSDPIQYGTIPTGFDVIPKLLDWKFGLTEDRPGQHVTNKLTQVITYWSAVVAASGSACYPIHLGTLQLLAAKVLGYEIAPNLKKQYCFIMNKIDMPLTDYYCKGATSFLNDYQPNIWEYRHQRCPRRETPDANGRQTPGLDYVVLHRLTEVFKDE